jgi:RNA polymerase sigma-70 factor (ECF subfamily)
VSVVTVPRPTPLDDGAVTERQLLARLPAIEQTVRRALVARNGLHAGSDAAAEAMAWAWQHRDRLATIDEPAAYLYRVGQTAARRLRRWQRRESQLGFEPIANDPPGSFDAELFGALARLRRDQRVAVVMVHCYSYRYREVAQLLGISEAAVTNHVHRGLARLRVLLGER